MLLVLLGVVVAVAASPPHILMIVADDLGWGGLCVEMRRGFDMIEEYQFVFVYFSLVAD